MFAKILNYISKILDNKIKSNNLKPQKGGDEYGRQERQLWLWVYWTKAGQSKIHKRQKETQVIQVIYG